MFSAYVLLASVVVIISLKLFFKNEEVWPAPTPAEIFRKAIQDWAKAMALMVKDVNAANQAFKEFAETLNKHTRN